LKSDFAAEIGTTFRTLRKTDRPDRSEIAAHPTTSMRLFVVTRDFHSTTSVAQKLLGIGGNRSEIRHDRNVCSVENATCR